MKYLLAVTNKLKGQYMEKGLNEFKIGEKGTIKVVNGEGKLRRRLFDMGVTPGAKIELIKKAPLGDPLEVHIRNYVLTLRKSEASLVIMEVEE